MKLNLAEWNLSKYLFEVSVFSFLIFIGATGIVVAAGPALPYSPAALPSPSPFETQSGTHLPSNSIIDLEIFGDYVWLATGRGLARFHPSDSTWLSLGPEDGFGQGGVSGLTVGTTSWGDTIVWAATAIDTTIGGQSYPAGGGVGYSLDMGVTWAWMPQPIDDRDETEFAPTTTNVQNITYDIGILRDRVWIVSWGGGVRYLDMTPEGLAEGPGSLEWVNRPPDNDPFDVLEHYNHRGFSVAVLDTLLWIGTAQGVNLSRDNGVTWQNFAHSSNEGTLTGNFVTALGAQSLTSGGQLIWAGSWAAEGGGEYYGVSISSNSGIFWNRVLGSPEEPIRVHNFAFDDSLVYAVGDAGLLKSADLGATWGQFPPIIDPVSGERTFEDARYSAAVGLGKLWVGGPEGLAWSEDGGANWRLARTFPHPGQGGEPVVYAYPNPFSPSRIPVVRFQYQLSRGDYVSLDIYDFAMELLIRPVKNQWRSAGDRNETWDGRGPGGSEIANGVYFYRISGGGQERWGKLMILD